MTGLLAGHNPSNIILRICFIFHYYEGSPEISVFGEMMCNQIGALADTNARFLGSVGGISDTGNGVVTNIIFGSVLNREDLLLCG